MTRTAARPATISDYITWNVATGRVFIKGEVNTNGRLWAWGLVKYDYCNDQSTGIMARD